MAAELWRVPLATVLEKARAGVIPSKLENGFTFIDVAPGGETRCKTPEALRPATFTVVTTEESLALQQPLENQVEDWRMARQSTARSRLGPRQSAA